MDLMNQSYHLQKVIDHFTIEQITNNWSQLKASIYVAQHLAILGFLGGSCERMQKHANAWSWRCMHTKTTSKPNLL